MKVAEAKSKLCPYVNSNCVCDECMAWVYTKTQREMTFEEKKRLKEYEKELMEIMSIKLKKDLEEKYSDILSLNLESDEDEKEGYCKRIEK